MEPVDLSVFAALSWELGPILDSLGRVRSTPLPGFRSWVGRTAQHRVRVVRTGVGPDRARAAAQAVARQDSIGSARSYFLSTGCAGGLQPQVVSGDLVLGSWLVRQDGSRVEPFDGASATRLASWAEYNGLAVRRGGLYSVDSPLLTSAQKRAARDGWPVVAVDMESAAIAEVASSRAGGFVALRVVLDPLDVTIPDRLASGPASYAVGAEVGSLASLQRVTQMALGEFFGAFFRNGGVDALMGSES